MHTLIASAPHADTFGYSMPPPGLLRLGGAVRDAGHGIRLDDLAFRVTSGEVGGDPTLAASCARHLARGPRPDLFGLSVMGATLPIALAIMERLRPEWPDAVFALGGPGMNGTDTETLRRFPWVDLVVRGEGERTVPELIEALAAGRDPLTVHGVTARGPGGAPDRAPDRAQIRDLAELPDYAWDLLPPIERYKEVANETDGLVPVDSGRGCVYDCSFCSIGRTWSRRSRALPAARLADEIEAVGAMPRAKRAYLCHDIFGADRAHALALCAELERRRCEVPWEVRARADHLDRELLGAMASAGCDRVLLGIESASPRLRAAHQKGMKHDFDARGRVADCVETGVTPILSLLLGLPGETEDELDATLAFAADCALLGGVQLSLHLVNPQPGCRLGDEIGAEAIPHGTVDVPPDMALGTGESPEERALIAAHPDLFSTWSHLPRPEEELRELAFFKEELAGTLMRFPRTFRALELALGARPLDLARGWYRDGRSFETFAAERASGTDGAAAVDALLAWEVALIRAAAAGPRRGRTSGPRAAATPLRSAVDLGSATDELRARALPRPAGDPHWFAVQVPPAARPGALDRVRTLRISADVARVLALAPEDLAGLTRTSRGAAAVQALADKGLLVLPPTAPTAPLP